MFQGRWPNSLSLDTKNRLAVPARFRVELMDQDGNVEFMAGVLEDPCIYLHSRDQHKRFLDRITPHFGETKAGRAATTFLLSRFLPVHCDAQGRITLPQALIDDARIKGEICLIAQDSRLEAWGIERLKVLETEVKAGGFADILEAAFAEEKRERQTMRLHGSAPSGGDREGKTSG